MVEKMADFTEEVTPVDRKYIMTDLTQGEVDILEATAKEHGLSLEEWTGLVLHRAIMELNKKHKTVGLERPTAQYSKVK